MNNLSDTSLPKSSRLKRINQFFKKLLRKEDNNSLRETLEELIEEIDEVEPSIESDERLLLGNVLNLRELKAYDVMIPRADIVAVSHNIDPIDLIATMTRTGLSRIPVYKETLDDVIGMVHMKDMLAWSLTRTPFKLRQTLREVLFISPSMRTLDLLLQMRQTGAKMALVVDEYGGVDGLVTFANLIEEIIGDIQIAHDQNTSIQLQHLADGTISVDARYNLEELSNDLSLDLSVPETDGDVDSVGGLVVFIAGRVPVRGEIIFHPLGFEFEVLDADPRRVKRVLIRGLKKIHL
jgi:CBS domain containing-hemolysin-like protein